MRVDHYHAARGRVQDAVVVHVGVVRFEVGVRGQGHVAKRLLAEVGQSELDRDRRPGAHHRSNPHPQPLVGRFDLADCLHRVNQANRLDNAEVLDLAPCDRRACASCGAVVVVDVVAEPAKLSALGRREALPLAFPKEMAGPAQGKIGGVVLDPDRIGNRRVGVGNRRLGQIGKLPPGRFQTLGKLVVRAVEGEQDDLDG